MERAVRSAKDSRTNELLLTVKVPYANWGHKENQRRFFEDLRVSLSLKTLEDFYSVSPNDIRARGAAGLIDYCHEGLLGNALQSVYPTHDWQPWRFERVPYGFWNSKANQRTFLDAVHNEVNGGDVRQPLSMQDIKDRDGYGLLSKFNGSSSRLLQAVYPDHSWGFEKIFSEQWDTIDGQRLALSLLGQRIGVKEMEDWYHVTAQDLARNGGAALLSKHGSVASLVKSVLSEHRWNRWKFAKSKGYWDCETTRMSFLEDLAEHIGLPSVDELRLAVSAQQIKDYGGAGLISKYGSVERLMEEVLSKQPTIEVRKEKLKLDNIESNQRLFMDNLGRELHLNTMEDWYRVTATGIRQHGGTNLLARHGTLDKLLQAVYPHHAWEVSRFRLPGYWNDVNNQRHFMDELGKKLAFERLGDWYQITSEQLVHHGGSQLLTKYNGSIVAVLMGIYPEHRWKATTFTQRQKVLQIGNKLRKQ